MCVCVCARLTCDWRTDVERFRAISSNRRCSRVAERPRDSSYHLKIPITHDAMTVDNFGLKFSRRFAAAKLKRLDRQLTQVVAL